MKEKLLLLLIAFTSCLVGAKTCGNERWDVKTLTDKSANEVKLTPIPTTVAALRKLKPPVKVTNTLPRQDSEKQVYSANVWIIGYKHEVDDDYHVVISTVGKNKEMMIFEIPAAHCGRDRETQIYNNLRQEIDTLGLTPSDKFITLQPPIEAEVEGVVFFDKCHGQTGRAPNCVEFHPGLKVAIKHIVIKKR